jgi:hypothetical protein
MELLYITASSPGKKFVHYSAAQRAPWLWYETADVGKVPATGGHGTDLFKVHPELPGIIVDWFVTTPIKTPGHAPADTVASAIKSVRPAAAPNPARKIPRRSCGRKLRSASLLKITNARATSKQPPKSLN